MKKSNTALTLKVKEALSKDVGRAIARIDPEDMKDLGLEVGDIIEINGKRKTAAKTMPCYAEDRGKKIIQIDGISRENAQIGLDEKVRINRIDSKPANKITLSPLTISSLLQRDSDTKYIGSLIEGLPIISGDKIRATFFGSRSSDFKVVDTIPDGVVLINAATLIRMETKKQGEAKQATVSYEDIGGLGSQIQRIREMIELPLRYPQVFERLGIGAPKGVFLYGPPGTGKTLIARAVANETDAYFTHISGPEIMCVGRKTPIFVDNKLISAEELYSILKEDCKILEAVKDRETILPTKKLKVKSLGSDLKITDEEISEATKLLAKGYEVEFTNKAVLTTSINQPFAKLREDGEIEWVAVRGLKVGDSVAQANCFVLHENKEIEWVNKLDRENIQVVLSEEYSKEFGKSKVKLREIIDMPREALRKAIKGIKFWKSKSNEGKSKSIRPVWEVTPQLARFLGGMLAEGSIAKRMDEVCFANNNLQLQKEFSDYFHSLFGIEKERIKISNGKVYVHSYSLSHFLHKGLGLCIGKKTKSISVPSYLFSVNPEIVGAFLSGLFDGDGSMKFTGNYPNPHIYSKNKRFLQELQTLIQIKLSIPSTVNAWPTKLGRMYALTVTTTFGRKRFLDAVAKRSSRFKKITMSTKRDAEGGEDIIPVAPLLKRIKNKLGLTYGKSIPENSIEPYISGRFNLTRRKLRDIYAILSEHGDTPELDRIKRLLDAEIYFTKVKRITKKQKEFLYDFGIEGNSNFLGGSPLMVLHNSKFYGESESKLRGIFEDAQVHAPAIIFIDEIDSIAPKREEMGSEKQVERRVVAQLLSLLDGLESRGQVIVIGATNIPNTIDPALRRPGRFDREISIPIPDKNGRLEILGIHTRGMPLAEDVSREKIAEITHGFVGADLEALAREAAMSALRKILPKIDFEMADIPYETLMKLEVTMDNFLEAMKEVEPSAIREFFVEVPDVKWDEVGGLENIKEELKEAVEWPIKYSDIFKQANTNPPKGILLYGAPGTGKTLLAKAVASQTGVNFISVKGPSLISKFVGESERAIRDVFKTAKQAAPTILFFDEIDSLVPKRGAASTDGHVGERVMAQFLAEMDGIEELKGVVVLAATNRLDLIDPAILRSGRFDLLLELPKPDERTREEIFKIHTKNKPLVKDVDLKGLVKETEGETGSDIEFICRKAASLAIREFIGNPKEKNTLVIKKKHFEEAIKLVKGQGDRKLGPSSA